MKLHNFQFQFKPICVDGRELPIRFYDCPGNNETIGSQELEMLINGHMANGSEVYVHNICLIWHRLF